MSSRRVVADNYKIRRKWKAGIAHISGSLINCRYTGTTAAKYRLALSFADPADRLVACNARRCSICTDHRADRNLHTAEEYNRPAINGDCSNCSWRVYRVIYNAWWSVPPYPSISLSNDIVSRKIVTKEIVVLFACTLSRASFIYHPTYSSEHSWRDYRKFADLTWTSDGALYGK